MNRKRRLPMRKIYTSIDLGSSDIKVVVDEVIQDEFYCLAAVSVPSKGIKKGWVVDPDSAAASLTEALKEVEEMLGIAVNQAIVTIPSYHREFAIAEGKVKIEGETQTVDYEDVIRSLQDANVGKIPEGRRLVTTIPISFHVDGNAGIKNPVGEKGETLAVKAVVTTVPKENIDNINTVLQKCNVTAIDIALSETGDYYELRNDTYDRQVGAVINIGYDTTKVAVYNKGIMIKNEVINIGSRHIDKDIRFVYHVDKATAKYLKEHFAVSNKRYADVNDTIEVLNVDKEKISLNQLEISEVVEARIVEILRLAKKQINILTNREISYIIITGGISELAGFQYVVDNVLGREATTLSITSMGLRNNKFSSASGLCRYFHEKLTLRGRQYSMLSDSITTVFSSRNKTKTTDPNNETIISKVFGYFFDNN